MDPAEDVDLDVEVGDQIEDFETQLEALKAIAAQFPSTAQEFQEEVKHTKKSSEDLSKAVRGHKARKKR